MKGYNNDWVKEFDKLFEDEIREGLKQSEAEEIEEYQFSETDDEDSINDK